MEDVIQNQQRINEQYIKSQSKSIRIVQSNTMNQNQPKSTKANQSQAILAQEYTQHMCFNHAWKHLLWLILIEF